MIDPQKTPLIAQVNGEYHIYDSSDSPARCGEHPARYENTMNRSWKPNLSHLIKMDGHDEIHERIWYKASTTDQGRIPLCQQCSQTAQSDNPKWHSVLSLPFEKAQGSLVQQGHDMRLARMPKGALVGWVEHKQKPQYLDIPPTRQSGRAMSRNGYGWNYTNWTNGFTGWTKTKIGMSRMLVSFDDHAALIQELRTCAANTDRDEATIYFFPADDICFLMSYTDGKYRFASAWTFAQPDFEVHQMSKDEFITSGYWFAISKDVAEEGDMRCPGCETLIPATNKGYTTLQHHECHTCKWQSIQPFKVDLIPIEE